MVGWIIGGGEPGEPGEPFDPGERVGPLPSESKDPRANFSWLIRIGATKQGMAGTREIVGLIDPVLAETTIKSDLTLPADDLLTRTTLDYTTYPDRAVIKLYNGRGFGVYMTRLQLHGKPIIRTSGGKGSLYLDGLRREDDIRRNGEVLKEIGNNYIFDATQVATLGDFWYKKCGLKAHTYPVTLNGMCPWYEPGERYVLQVGGSGFNEYIDAVVECYSVDVQQEGGSLGTATVSFRECLQGWAKTTFYSTRFVTSSSPKRRTK